jgi:hypothetical protein
VGLRSAQHLVQDGAVGRGQRAQFLGAFSFTWCSVAPTAPNSATGQYRAMKRASEVPPPVSSAGVTPVLAAMARDSASTKGPGRVRKLSPEHSATMS